MILILGEYLILLHTLLKNLLQFTVFHKMEQLFLENLDG